MTGTGVMPDTPHGLKLSLYPSVIIDDKWKHAIDLLRGLQKAGLTCTPLLYDSLEGLLNAECHDFSGVRFVFLDLNLSPGSGVGRGASSMANHITKALTELKLEAPYLLFVWSDLKVHPEDLLPMAIERGNGKIPQPVGVAVLDKNQFMSPEETDAAPDTEAIAKKVNDTLRKYPQLTAMMSWEARVHAASGRVTSRLFGLAETPDLVKFKKVITAAVQEAKQKQDGDVAHGNEELGGILSALGKGAYGEHLWTDRAGGVEAALLPLLDDQLTSCLPVGENYNKLWEAALPRGTDDRCKLGEEQAGDLNKALLIDTSSHRGTERGIWFDLPAWQEANKRLGFGIELQEEAKQIFVKNEGEIGKTLQGKFRETIGNSSLGVLCCSAPCDHAWNKIGTRLGFLGILIDGKAIDSKSKKKSFLRPTDSLYISSVFSIDGSQKALVVSFSHVSGICTASCNEMLDDGSFKFRVRDQLLDEIIARYAAHISRPGAISVLAKK